MDYLEKVNPLTTSLIAVITIVGTYEVLRHLRKNNQQELGNFKRSSPSWNLLGDTLWLIRFGGSFSKFVNHRKKALTADDFYVYLTGFTKQPGLVVTRPEDQAEIMKKEGKLKFHVEMPDTIKQTHGPGNMQMISGQEHQFLRKIFTSILSPSALESFVPIILNTFEKMWVELEQKSANVKSGVDDPIIIQDAICTAQFFLMCKLLYGLEPSTASLEAVLASLRMDFELQLHSHFQPPKSSKFQKGLAASKRIRTFLSERFHKTLEERRELFLAQRNGKKVNIDRQLPVIGNALESIADALLKDGVDTDSKVLSDVLDNLNLLLEASHGTTMTITTSTLYFLNRKENAKQLEKLYQEMADHGNQKPSLDTLKSEMPYAEGCIKEAMRLAPLIGQIGYVMDKGLEMDYKGQHLSGPISFMLNFSHNYQDATIFPEPTSFVPERWIAGHQLEASERARLAYKPFGTGRHMCLGYKLALIVMKASLYCFATNGKRVIEFDQETVTIESSVFPECTVSGGLPGRVVRVAE